MSRRLLVIRHGETASNAARILQTPDVPLSERGWQQARLLAQRLVEDPPDLILSSDYQRARDTADAIVEATGAPLRVDPLLRERNFGEWRGRPYAELDFDPFDLHRVPPGGESWASFHGRVAEAFEAIRQLTAALEGSVAVVTHGLVCRALTNRHLAPHLPDFEDPWLNTSVTEVTGPPWELLRVNCALHLEDTPDEVAPA